MMNDIFQLAWNPPAPGDPFLDQLMVTYHLHVGSRLAYYSFLYGLIQLYVPKLALELGVEQGVGSAHMASAARAHGGHVVGIDQHFHHIPDCEIDEMYGNYDFIHGDTTAATTVQQVKDYVDIYGPIGVLFQDSSHHYLHSIKEWELYSPLMGENSIWVCDDISPPFHDPLVDPPGKGMVQYFEELPGEKMLIPDNVRPGNALGVILL